MFGSLNYIIIFRYILEVFFYKFHAEALQSKDLKELIILKCPTYQKDFLSSSPKVSTINNVLLDENVQEKAWKLMKVPNDIILPTFSDRILYGKLSENLHFPGIRVVYMSSMEDDAYKKFFEYMVSKNRFQYEEFDEEEAALGEQILYESKTK